MIGIPTRVPRSPVAPRRLPSHRARASSRRAGSRPAARSFAFARAGGPVARLEHGHALGLQIDAARSPDRRLVVDNQYPCHALRFRPPTRNLSWSPLLERRRELEPRTWNRRPSSRVDPDPAAHRSDETLERGTIRAPRRPHQRLLPPHRRGRTCGRFAPARRAGCRPPHPRRSPRPRRSCDVPATVTVPPAGEYRIALSSKCARTWPELSPSASSGERLAFERRRRAMGHLLVPGSPTGAPLRSPPRLHRSRRSARAISPVSRLGDLRAERSTIAVNRSDSDAM